VATGRQLTGAVVVVAAGDDEGVLEAMVMKRERGQIHGASFIAKEEVDTEPDS
jgi:hypothetical protein